MGVNAIGNTSLSSRVKMFPKRKGLPDLKCHYIAILPSLQLSSGGLCNLTGCRRVSRFSCVYLLVTEALAGSNRTAFLLLYLYSSSY